MSIKIPLKFDESEICELRNVTVTGKRQVTIPKAFFDALNEPNSFETFLLSDGIYMRPCHHESTVYEDDIETIVYRVFTEGYTGKSAVREIARRVCKYNEFMKEKIKQFEKEMNEKDEDE